MTRLVVMLCLMGACRATVPLDREDAWVVAVQASAEERSLLGARAAWAFLSQTDPEDPRHERARRLLARSLEDLGLRQAAGLLYRDLVLLRRDPLVASEALTGVRRLVEQGPYDRALLVGGLVASGGIAGVPDEHQAFVAWHQTVDLSRRGLTSWSLSVRGQIPSDDPLMLNVRWLDAVEMMSGGELDMARDALDLLVEEPLSPALAADVQRARARLAFQAGDYEAAMLAYDQLGEAASKDSALLIERAWTSYHLGDARSALGQLLALDAPTHSQALFPERYVLEALALRRLCQFAGARSAGTRLHRELGPLLDELHQGTPPARIERLRQAARGRPVLRELSAVEQALSTERATVSSVGLPRTLEDWLDGLYDRAQADVSRRLEPELDREAEAIAEELLAAEEGVELVAHELGVALLRGRRRPQGPEEVAAPETPLAGTVAIFRHRGEFWNDELDDLVVVAEDRCVQ